MVSVGKYTRALLELGVVYRFLQKTVNERLDSPELPARAAPVCWSSHLLPGHQCEEVLSPPICGCTVCSPCPDCLGKPGTQRLSRNKGQGCDSGCVEAAGMQASNSMTLRQDARLGALCALTGSDGALIRMRCSFSSSEDCRTTQRPEP